MPVSTPDPGGPISTPPQPAQTPPAQEPTSGCGPGILKWCHCGFVHFPYYDATPCPGACTEEPCGQVPVVGGAGNAIGGVGPAIGGVASAVGDWGTALLHLLRPLLSPDFWKGAGLLAAAGVLGLVGVLIWFRRDVEAVVP